MAAAAKYIDAQRWQGKYRVEWVDSQILHIAFKSEEKV